MRSRLLSVALVGLVLLGACGGSGSSSDDAAASTTTTLDPNDPFTPTPAAAGADGGGGDGGSSGGAASSGSSTTAAGGGSQAGTTPTTAAAPRTAKADANGAPLPGTYSYRRGESDVTLRVTVTDVAGGSTRQTHRLGTENQAEETSLRFGGGPTMLVALRNIRDGQNGATCTLDPSVTLRPVPLAVGATWSGTGTCTLGTSEGAPQARQTESGKATATEVVTIDGQQIQVVVFERTSIQEVLISGAVVATTKKVTTDRYAPRLGLTVSSVGTVEATVTGKPPESGTFELRLQSLTVT